MIFKFASCFRAVQALAALRENHIYTLANPHFLTHANAHTLALSHSRAHNRLKNNEQVLKLERQVLKKRVKRDFIDLGNQPTVSGSLGEHAVNRAQQQQQPNGFSPRPIQMLQPNGAGRPAQYLRPANQPPGSLHYHQPPAGQAAPQNAATMPQLQVENRRLGSGHPLVAFPSLSNNAGSVRLKPAQQQYFDQLEMTPSGPPPFFLHANFSANQQQRPPPPPIQFSEQRHHGANHNSSTPAQFEQANQTARPAPFNDPSWPLMWYLVSSLSRLSYFQGSRCGCKDAGSPFCSCRRKTGKYCSTPNCSGRGNGAQLARAYLAAIVCCGGDVHLHLSFLAKYWLLAPRVLLRTRPSF